MNVRYEPRHLVYRRRQNYDGVRRIVDATIAMLALAIASPILVAASVAILLEDGGPILFTQRRVGRMGRLFTIYKLRTMRVNECIDALSPTRAADPRISRVGYWLRKTSIDEFPQFFNVIRGDMAIVGPRPEMPFVVGKYQGWQHLRHLATPGITGLWQVTCRSTVALHESRATALDLQYITSASHATDARILFKTFAAIFSTQGAF